MLLYYSIYQNNSPYLRFSLSNPTIFNSRYVNITFTTITCIIKIMPLFILIVTTLAYSPSVYSESASTGYSCPLKNTNNVAYYITAFIGTPSQQFQLYLSNENSVALT